MMRQFGMTATAVVVALIGTTAIGTAVTEAKEWKSGIKWEKPKAVAPGPIGGPPADAIVLFDGKDMSAWEGGENWLIKDGYAQVAKSGIKSKQPFGSCQLHVEWASPGVVKGSGQGRGNSGIYLMGKYELQILDSYENETYPDGQAGAIYKQKPPAVNACRKPGAWQTYDIIFNAPEFGEDGTLVKPAFLTVLHNGVLIHNHFELKGGTYWDQPPKYKPHSARLPIAIQNHGNPVRFRNLWIREL